MITAEFRLTTGLTIGEKTHFDVKLREATGADLIEATEESERLVKTAEDGYQLVASPSFIGLHTLRRQIVSIGEYEGPLTLTELKKLSSHDLALIQEKALAMDDATLDKTVAGRGRD